MGCICSCQVKLYRSPLTKINNGYCTVVGTTMPHMCGRPITVLCIHEPFVKTEEEWIKSRDWCLSMQQKIIAKWAKYIAEDSCCPSEKSHEKGWEKIKQKFPELFTGIL